MHSLQLILLLQTNTGYPNVLLKGIIRKQAQRK